MRETGCQSPRAKWRDEMARALALHHLTTPVQCACGWRETDPGAGTWAEHVADAASPVIARARAETLRTAAEHIEGAGLFDDERRHARPITYFLRSRADAIEQHTGQTREQLPVVGVGNFSDQAEAENWLVEREM